MALKNLQSHPEQSNYTTPTGEKFFKYQLKALEVLKKSYSKWHKNGQVDKIKELLVAGVQTKFIFNKLRMLQLGTGDGKSFMLPSILKELTDMYFDFTGKYCTIMVASPLSEVLNDHKRTLLTDFQQSADSKNFEVISDKADSLLPVKMIDELVDGKLNIKNKHTIILLSNQYLNGHSEELSKLGVNIIIVDEAKGLNFGSDKEAKNEGDSKPLLAWWKSIQSLEAYIVVLNATPSTSHTKNDYDKYEILAIPDEIKLWKYPWLAEIDAMFTDACKEQKIDIVIKSATKWAIKLIEHNHNFDYLSGKFGNTPEFQEYEEEWRLKAAMMKCSGSSTKEGITVYEAKDILENLNKELKGTKVKIFDEAKKKFIEVLYDKDWICPIISNKDNPKEDVIAKINNPAYSENFFLVCEKGTYGINIPSLSLLIHIRDTIRHLGKVYTVEQLLGRLTRNRFTDNYQFCDFIVSLNPDIEDFKLLKKAFMNMTEKSAVLFSCVKVNKTAINRLQDKLPDEGEYSEMIDKILLGDFKWIPHDKDMMNSSGSDIKRSYDDTRTDKCSVCDNAVFDAHENKLLDQGKSLVEARFYSVKDIMQNAHTHTRDDNTQRPICNSCHAIETRENKHYLASDHPDRKKVD